MEFLISLLSLQPPAILVPAISVLWEFVKAWWWVFPPFLLFKECQWMWLIWRTEAYDELQKHTLYEFRFPQNVEKPLKAMENVFAGFWQVYDPPNYREFWFEGQYQLKISLELVSTEGQVHFYLRAPKSSYQIIESALYSQYPEAELIEVEDYTKQVPQNIPNREWRLWGAAFKLEHDEHYPIRTYEDFEPNPETREEKRVDPMALIVEAMSKLGEKEHLWIQFHCTPYGNLEKDWDAYMAKGKELVEVLVHRKSPDEKPPRIPLREDLKAAVVMTTTGKDTERKIEGGVEEEQGLLAPELRLTPGERDVVAAVEQKMSKQPFKVNILFAYFAHNDVYFSPTKALPFEYFNMFANPNLNFLTTLRTVKVHTIPLFFLDKRRGFLRRRKVFKSLLWRTPVFPVFPSPSFTLNIEEMASLFHFPSKITFPSDIVPRVETKKGEAPPGLPMEE